MLRHVHDYFKYLLKKAMTRGRIRHGAAILTDVLKINERVHPVTVDCHRIILKGKRVAAGSAAT